jgi:hypothetical protein
MKVLSFLLVPRCLGGVYFRLDSFADHFAVGTNLLLASNALLLLILVGILCMWLFRRRQTVVAPIRV